MSTLRELLAEHTQLHTTAVDHLQRLVGEWQLLSDLSFSDLALWVRINDHQLLCVAQVRPTTGATVWPDDLVTRVVPDRSHPLAGEAWRTGQLTGGEVTTLPNHTRAKRVVVPVRFRGEVIAVMNRDIALTSHDSSRL